MALKRNLDFLGFEFRAATREAPSRERAGRPQRMLES
jgi:hypothetical protein